MPKIRYRPPEAMRDGMASVIKDPCSGSGRERNVPSPVRRTAGRRSTMASVVVRAGRRFSTCRDPRRHLRAYTTERYGVAGAQLAAHSNAVLTLRERMLKLHATTRGSWGSLMPLGPCDPQHPQ